MDEPFPETLAINAWTGQTTASGPVAGTWHKWATRQHALKPVQALAAPEPADDREWQDPRVGWGLVVADNEALSEADRARGTDLPEPLRELVDARKGPVLRYRDQAGIEFLRAYYSDRAAQDLTIATSNRGLGVGRLPKYLLIWGSPAPGRAAPCVPWRFQYLLNTTSYVGRLDLAGQALENYVGALRSGWKDAKARSDQPVVWAVDLGGQDITSLMRGVVAAPLAKKLRDDGQIGANVRSLDGNGATAVKLIEALAEPARPPAFVLSTSHGMTGPLDDPAAMTRDLGLPVDINGNVLEPARLLEHWRPDGAVWYAHACCSAGSAAETQFDGLLPADSTVDQILKGVAKIGARVAPLPQALLGAERPLRAFIGHVEPTFDWTLRHTDTRQALTGTLQEALYDRMFRKLPEPVGMAFKGYFAQIGPLFGQWFQAEKDSKQLDPQARDRARRIALRTQLTALDRQALVILGDPTAALPPLS